jgi:putative DNA primase/helicase
MTELTPEQIAEQIATDEALAEALEAGMRKAKAANSAAEATQQPRAGQVASAKVEAIGDQFHSLAGADPPASASQSPVTAGTASQEDPAPIETVSQRENHRQRRPKAVASPRTRSKRSEPAPEETGTVEVPHTGDPEKGWPSDEELPCYRVYDQPQTRAGRPYPRGSYDHGFEGEREDDEQPRRRYNRWLFGALHVLAYTADDHDENYGLLLEFESLRGVSKRHVMLREVLMGPDGTEAARVLASMGLHIPTAHRKEVIKFLDWVKPKCFWRSVTSTGWSPPSSCFVLPEQVVGEGKVWFQSKSHLWPYSRAGDIDDWKENVAAMAVGNPYLMVSISAGFTGPLLAELNLPGGGIHYYGDSTIGKTTCAMGGASVWGSPDVEHGSHSYMREWRNTVNGLEAHAALRKDTLFVLDELHLIDPKELSSAIYLLAHGHGKGRANKSGGPAPDAQFRIFVASTGESSVEAHLRSGNLRVRAGQALRLLDISAKTNKETGIFSDLHDFENAAELSDAIRAATKRSYGYAGPLFVEHLIEALAKGVDLRGFAKRLLPAFGDKLNHQQNRAANLMAAVAIGGELATEFGIVPWQRGQAIAAAIELFKVWLASQKAPPQGAEHGAILQMVQEFIQANSDGRFSDIDRKNYPGDKIAPLIHHRAGYWREDDSGNRIYMLYPAALREAAKGFAIERITEALEEAGALRLADDGKRSIPTRTPEGTTRLYHIDPAKLTLPEDDEKGGAKAA